VEAAEKLRGLLARRESMAIDLAAVDAECTSQLAQCCDVARTDLGEVCRTSKALPCYHSLKLFLATPT
jgi:hypothetical protein